MRPPRFAALLLALLALCTSAPPRAAAREAHVLRFADGLDIATLNPLFATSGNIGFISELTMAYLLTIDERGHAQPELATVVPSQQNGGISADGKTITWHLRRDAKWSDGAPFDADDVAFTVKTILDPATNVVSRDGWDQIERVTEPDKYTAVFHLKAPYAPFFETYFARGGLTCVLPKHILGNEKTINDAPYNALPIGIGPFRYTSYKRGDSVTMEANPNYFRGRPKLTKIVYKIVPNDNTLYTQLQTGELDLWATVTGAFTDRVKALNGKTTVSVLSPFRSGIYFNVAQPALNDRTVRQALRFATDRPGLFDKVQHRAGVPIQSVMARVSLGFDPTLAQTPFDPARANALLDRAGWKRGASGIREKNGVPLAVDVVIPGGSQTSQASVEVLRDSWGKIGARIDERTTSVQQFFAPYASGGILQTGKYGAALFSQGSDIIGDLSNAYACNRIPPNGFNQSRYCNREVDAEMARYITLYDDNARTALAKRIQRQIDDDVPVIELYERAFVYAFDPALKGFKPSTWLMFPDAMNLDI